MTEIISDFHDASSSVLVLLMHLSNRRYCQNLHTDCSKFVLFEARTSASMEIQAYASEGSRTASGHLETVPNGLNHWLPGVPQDIEGHNRM